MAVPRFSNEFFDAVTADIHCRTAASRKRRFGGQVNVSACFRGRQLGRYRRFGVFKKRSSRVVHDLGGLGPCAPREKSCEKRRAKDRRRYIEPCPAFRAVYHSTFSPALSG